MRRHAFIALLTTALSQAPALASAAEEEAAAPAPERWTPDTLIEQASFGNAAPSPDGRRTAYIVRHPVMTEDTSTFRGVLYVASAGAKDVRRFTFGTFSASAPQWSPDGRWLAFTGAEPGAKPNLHVIAGDGGGARQLTTSDTGVSGYRWAPDSSQIAYLSVDEPDEDEQARNKAKDDAITVDADYKYQHLWLVRLPAAPEADTPEPERLTAGPYQVSPGYAPGFDWAPDGAAIAFAHTPTPELNDWPRADISVVDVASGSVRALQDSPASEYAPRYAPDGATLAFVRSQDPPSWMRDARVALLDLDSGEVEQLRATPDESPFLLGWLNGSTLLALETTGTTSSLLKLRRGADPERFAEAGAITGANLSASGRHVALVSMGSSTPPEAVVSRTGRWSPTAISNVHGGESRFPVGYTETVTWLSSDEMEIEGLLTYPVGYTDGDRVPLLLLIHGGPAGVHTQRYLATPYPYPLAAFAAEGYALLRANPRGSGGYGAEFRRANRNDWGGGDFQDLMAGVDKVIDMGVADPQRLGVMGWSYGGYMTSWVITHTNRFKAASIGAPVTDLVAFNGTADIVDFLPDYFSGDFWERESIYRERSPLMHVANARTPALIQHGQADLRVPLGQGTALYRALKRRGVETRMVIYPRAPHGPREPRQILHLMRDNLAWFQARIPTG